MFAWEGKILRIDLTNGTSSTEDLPHDLMRDYIGGRGAGVKILFDEIDPRIDPLDPANKLIFATGPLTGSGVPAGGRFVAISKSPLTGAIANPNSGGYFGANLKFAGYDVLIVEGRSPELIYVAINNDTVEIRSAEHLRGKWTSATEEAIRNEVGENGDEWDKNGMSVINIGPAGENLNRFASIMSDGGRALGRSGLGAVMGSKNLKGIAVKGNGEVQVADVKGFTRAVADFLKEAREKEQLEKRLMWGTWILIGRAQKTGTLATRNFQQGYFNAFKEYEDPAAIREKIWVRNESCYSCPFSCGKRSRIPDPVYEGTSKGPEHETIGLLGSNCGISDLYSICKMNYLCNELGMDTITAGASISCAMELFEKGYLKEKEIGYSLNFGNAEAAITLIKDTAFRRGIGDLLADGGYALAEQCGHPELFMGVKKQGLPAWHPQGLLPGLEVIGLQYATSNVGACHTRSVMTFHTKDTDLERLIPWTIHYQDAVAAIDCGVLCWVIYHGPLWEEKLLEWLKVVTGINYTQEQLSLIGERIWNLEHLFNLKSGLSIKDDILPERMINRAPPNGRVVNLYPMLTEYYRQRGWDEKGIPKAEKLNQLGLNSQITFPNHPTNKLT